MRTLLVLLVVGALSTGCTKGDQSITDRARKSADPKALAFLVEAEAALLSGHHVGALALADSAARRAPDLADAPFLKGRVLTAMRQFGPAREAYEQVLALDPAYPGAYLNLGNSAYLRGEPREALDLYRKERGAAESTEYLVQLGRAYADLGIRDSARLAFEQAIAADSQNATAWMWLGQLHEDAGDFEAALRHSQEGLSLRPQNANYAYVVGVQQLRNGDLNRSAETLQRVTREMPWHYAAHYNLSQALNGLGRTTEAALVQAKADTLLEHNREITRWENLVEANNAEPMLWVNYGNALHRAGRVDDAIEALSIAYSLEPRWLELQNNIANLYLLRGDTTAALERYYALLQLDSTRADVWLNLGTVYAMSGRFGAARRAWETTLRYQPEHPEARSYLTALPQ